MTLRRYAEAWLASRGLEDTTREYYTQSLRDHVYPTFGKVPIPGTTSAAVRTWHGELANRTGPTARAHAYALLRTILKANPCRVCGAGQ